MNDIGNNTAAQAKSYLARKMQLLKERAEALEDMRQLDKEIKSDGFKPKHFTKMAKNELAEEAKRRKEAEDQAELEALAVACGVQLEFTL